MSCPTSSWMNVHLLPVNLGYEGEADVAANFISDCSNKVLNDGFISDNFNITQLVGDLPVSIDVIEKEDVIKYNNADESFNKPQKSTVLHGRRLKGMDVDLGSYGFKGFVVNQKDNFVPISEIDKLTVWSNGTQVSPLDKIIQGLQYACISNKFHID